MERKAQAGSARSPEPDVRLHRTLRARPEPKPRVGRSTDGTTWPSLSEAQGPETRPSSALGARTSVASYQQCLWKKVQTGWCRHRCQAHAGVGAPTAGRVGG